MLKKMSIPLILIALYFAAYTNAAGQVIDPLAFPKDNYVLETKTVKTSSGDKIVTYHAYRHILYVTKPVDKDYQSLDVIVPVKINDIDINSANAPILFNIGVGGYMSVNNARKGERADNRVDFALAAGCVVVSPGCRGRDNKAADGIYFGKAPAAIVDLKAAVRYIRHNKGIIPGNVDWIVSVGCSAGGAISSLLGASGNSPLYESYLDEIGAANEKDNIYGCAAFSPIADLENADGAYEWMFGSVPSRSGLADQELSKQLKTLYAGYQSKLKLEGKNGFGTITADNYDKYLLQYYLIPSANYHLKNLTDDKRNEYLAKNKWIEWNGNGAAFNFTDYVAHVGRMKALPAFDDFEMKQPEPNEFGNKTVSSRHFTNFSLRHTTGNNNAEIDDETKTLVNLMNPMYFIMQKNSGCAPYWRLRNGSSDPHTSQTVMVNIAISLENLNKKVDSSLFWDGGHCADFDPEGFVAWIGSITGYSITR